MKQPATRELFAYWNDLRGERAAPERCEIDPAEIRTVLADTFMLDTDLAAGFPFRLAGTRVNALFDAELKATPFLSLWKAEERRNMAAVLTTVADGACPVVVGATVGPKGQEECGLELLFLPLRHHGKTHARILGLVKAASEPAWLGLLPVGPVSLRSLRIVDTMRHAMVEKIAVGQERPVLIAAPPVEALPSRKPYLRLIQGGL
jgi:hypothetical protein